MAAATEGAPAAAPAPRAASVFDEVRQSCHRFLASYAETEGHAPEVAIDREALARFAEAIPLAKLAEHRDGMSFPLRFETVAEEANFYSLLHLLNFGSGWRQLLHEHCGRGAWDTITYGVMGMYMTNNNMDADLLCNITLSDVGELFKIPLDVDVQVRPAVYQAQPHPLRPLADALRRVMNEAGNQLRSLRHKDFYEYLLDVADGRSRRADPKAPLTADELVRRLTRDFPSLNDRYKDTLLYKRAQILVADLFRHLRARDPRFEMADIDALTVFSDNVLAAVLRLKGVLVVSGETARAIDAGKPIPFGPRDTALRAAAVVACEEVLRLLLARARPGEYAPTSRDLDDYLWNLGKEGDNRKFPRHATRDTVFY